jgi:hypothetical protein
LSVIEIFQQSGSAKLLQFRVALIIASIFAGLEFVVLAEDGRWPISPLEPHERQCFFNLTLL